jgi:hypothetical protein
MSCLNTLENFREKADENNISYLKSKNVLPFYYNFLLDKSLEIRNVIILILDGFKIYM